MHTKGAQCLTSKRTKTKYLNNMKTHKAINGKKLQLLNNLSKKVYEVELVKLKIVHQKPVIFGFFVLQYAKLPMLELYYSFLTNFAISTSLRSLRSPISFPNEEFWLKVIVTNLSIFRSLISSFSFCYSLICDNFLLF